MKNQSCWILDLDRHEDVQLSQAVDGNVYWVSSRSPRGCVGGLLDSAADYRGAWWENFRLLVQLSGSLKVFEVGLSLAGSPSVARKVVKWSLSGRPAEWIQKELDRMGVVFNKA